MRFELHHGRGETDDHAWVWVPSLRAACVGDFFIWVFPNAGNPQKVQRYPREWATTLRPIAAKGPDYAAVAQLSREVIERIAWEVVPELAEVMIKQRLDELVRARQVS